MTQTTSLHDILWHFVASLTPSPFDTEEEEDEESKVNKENLEQVSKQCCIVFPQVFVINKGFLTPEVFFLTGEGFRCL